LPIPDAFALAGYQEASGHLYESGFSGLNTMPFSMQIRSLAVAARNQRGPRISIPSRERKRAIRALGLTVLGSNTHTNVSFPLRAAGGEACEYRLEI
jgi:hypothetical protein